MAQLGIVYERLIDTFHHELHLTSITPLLTSTAFLDVHSDIFSRPKHLVCFATDADGLLIAPGDRGRMEGAFDSCTLRRLSSAC
jgi:hypothetical protein